MKTGIPRRRTREISRFLTPFSTEIPVFQGFRSAVALRHYLFRREWRSGITDFESAKAEFLAAVEHIIWERRTDSERGLLSDWLGLLSRAGFSSLDFSFSPRELHDHYSPGEVVFSSTFSFHDPDYLRECCSPGPDCLAGKRCIPIGGVDGADGFIYLSDNLELGIAHLHHDDVFSASDLDAVVMEGASRLKVSLQAFVSFLRPQTNLAKLSASLDASKWLVVEDVGTMVRYEIQLSEDWDVGERLFSGPPESEEFFFELIRKGCATTDLSLLYCSPHLRERIEAILNS